jgi:hypothetical protein
MYIPSKLSLTISVLQNEKAQFRSYRKLRPWAALTVTTSSNESALVTVQHLERDTENCPRLTGLVTAGCFAPPNLEVVPKINRPWRILGRRVRNYSEISLEQKINLVAPRIFLAA